MLNRVTTWLMFVELVAFLAWAAQTSWTPLKGAGAAVIVTSAVVLMAARVELGRAFSVRAKASELVTTGVYRRVRNPIYLASGMLFFGVSLLVRSWWPMVIVLVLVVVQTRRARREAKVLTERFGEEYLAYRRQTWM